MAKRRDFSAALKAEVALGTWPGDLSDIKRWLSSGLVDAALVPEPLTGSRHPELHGATSAPGRFC